MLEQKEKISRCQREQKILEMLSSGRPFSPKDIAKDLFVSAATIRTDINGLIDKGVIMRWKGGLSANYHPAIHNRMRSEQGVKNAIAQKAAEFVVNYDEIMISTGTTCALTAQHFLGKKNVKVVTNSTLVIPYARINPHILLTVVGGRFYPSEEAIVGAAALRELQLYHPRLSIIGTDNFSLEDGFSASLSETAELALAMVRKADMTIVLADASKFGSAGFLTFLSLREIDVLITDSRLPTKAREEIKKMGVKLVLVDYPN